jgi:hypothetical protein
LRAFDQRAILGFAPVRLYIAVAVGVKDPIFEPRLRRQEEFEAPDVKLV